MSLVTENNDDSHSDKKAFDWYISSFGGKEFELYVVWQYPELISRPFDDYLTIQFTNTQSFIKPKDPGAFGMPNGFRITSLVPTQIGM